MFHRFPIAIAALALIAAAMPGGLAAQESKPPQTEPAGPAKKFTAQEPESGATVKNSKSKGLACAEPGLCGRCDCPETDIPAAVPAVKEDSRLPKGK